MKTKQGFFNRRGKITIAIAIVALVILIPVGYNLIANYQMDIVRQDGGWGAVSSTEKNIYGQPADVWKTAK